MDNHMHQLVKMESNYSCKRALLKIHKNRTSPMCTNR
jgi:hypothetical protein